MPQVLMPKATAVWLVENTTLTFDQISAFTGLHPLEVQAIAVIGKGESQPLVPTADGVREPQNRRVEIVLQ